ncbi:hypothetical protein GN244_ATG20999 [Phytophthora infestans]|uniref:Integrase catalytic domain-containing protein n=1 Tax=Phytophthora infestans TaxID=4787 RepID=A0A833W3N4_PHYIN|nr:hypothetical protein GN244_ATG20999 [Phytophthora infestans]KAF4150797.1 hypothetical protein GN958_ATG00020 [Phytophthora infestans]
MHPAPHTGSIVDRGADANPSGSQPAHGPFATGHGRAGGDGSSGPSSWGDDEDEGRTMQRPIAKSIIYNKSAEWNDQITIEIVVNKTVDDLVLTDASVKKFVVYKLDKMTRTTVLQHSLSGTPADQVCHMYRYDPLHAFSARLSLLYDRQLKVLRLVLFAQQGDQQDISLAMLDRQYETGTVELKTVRTDGGGKFSSRDFHNLFKKKGHRRQLTSAYSSFGIGVAEERR